MGNCTSQNAIEAPSTPEKQRSAAIDRQIAEDERNFKKECKILLLGSGESGKSTIVKQMKIIHLHGYSPDELLLYRSVVNRNVVESAQALVLAMRKFSLDCQNSVNRVSALPLVSGLHGCTAVSSWRVTLLGLGVTPHPRHHVFPESQN